MKKKWYNSLYVIRLINDPLVMITILIIALLFGNYTFLVGFHNMDIAVNEIRIQDMVNLEYGDCTNNTFELEEIDTNFHNHNLVYAYIKGLEQMIRGFYLSIFFAFVLGMYLFQFVRDE